MSELTRWQSIRKFHERRRSSSGLDSAGGGAAAAASSAGGGGRDHASAGARSGAHASSSSTSATEDNENDVSKFRYILIRGAGGDAGSPSSSFAGGRADGDAPGLTRSLSASVMPLNASSDGIGGLGQPQSAVLSLFRGFSQSSFAHNSIRTTKYTLLTFLPKSLFEQFRRLANMYFLSAAALSTTEMSPISPVLTVTPLAFVLTVSIVKEAIEDNRRRSQDNDINNRTTLVLRDGGFVRVRWSAVRVGDIVKVQKNENIPADLVFLASEKNDGTCYVETANLDGETNLKLRSCVRASADPDGAAGRAGAASTSSSPGSGGGGGGGGQGIPHSSSAGNIALDPNFSEESILSSEFLGRVQCEKPNTSLYTFIGNLYCRYDKYDLTPTEILLRGCRLRNTEYVIGGVIFTGMETKMMMNSGDARSKRSKLEKNMDKLILFMFAVLLSSSLLCAFFVALWTHELSSNMWYLDPANIDYQFNADNIFYVGISNFVTNYILYGYYIPISLYITIELIKIATLLLINFDARLVDRDSGIASCARTSNLHEELGQVHTILTDKTGTLTANRMEFFMCSINGIAYGSTDASAADGGGGATPAAPAVTKSTGMAIGRNTVAERPAAEGTDRASAAPYRDPSPAPPARQGRRGVFNLRDDRLCGMNWRAQGDPERIAMFFRCLALCHTAVPTEGGGSGAGGEIQYECESPDENALVTAAKEMGIVCHSRTPGSITVREAPIGGGGAVDVEYTILHVLGFSSDRKRMSVIVKDGRSGGILLFCKGADSVIFKRTARRRRDERRGGDGEEGAEDPMEAATRRHLSRFAELGLRTLCIAYKRVPEDDFLAWQKMYKKAKMSLNKRAEQVEATADMMERDLTLLGASAIEDRLQEGVPETIHSLREAGINIWMLTGDKLETAINIGHSCRLLSAGQRLSTVQIRDADGAGAKGSEAYRASKRDVYEQLTAVRAAIAEAPGREHGLVIEGEALGVAMSGASVAEEGHGAAEARRVALGDIFEEVATSSKTVICCRVSPLQKALVTRMVQADGNKVTLAVGDGANDVGMIQAADIGVGINGLEGMQAVLASDVSIPQFRFLSRLLLVHGRWCYKRLATTINLFFYKNVILGITLFIQCLFCFATGQTMYNTVYLSMYSVIFTSLQPLVYGLLEQDVPDFVSVRFPGLYRDGQRDAFFNLYVTGGWLLNGLYQGIVVAMVTILAEHYGVDSSSGQAHGMYTVGLTMFNSVLWCVSLQWCLIIEYWTFLHHLAIWGSIFLWYLFCVVFSEVFPPEWSTNMNKLYFYLARGSMLNLVSPLAVAIAILPFAFIRQLRRRLRPRDVEIIQEAQLHRREHHRGGDAAAAGHGDALFSPRGTAAGHREDDDDEVGCCGLGAARSDGGRGSPTTSLGGAGKAGAAARSTSSGNKVMPMMALSPMFEKAEDGPISYIRN